MGWFKADGGSMRTTYGYTFRLTEHHFSEKTMETLKYSYDNLAEDALLYLNTIAPPDVSVAAKNLSRAAGGVARGQEQAVERDTYALLAKHHADDQVLDRFWRQVTEVPEWVDFEQIQRGQEVLWRYAAPAMAGFAFQGLLGGTVSSAIIFGRFILLPRALLVGRLRL